MTPPTSPVGLPPAPSPEELESPAGLLLERSAAATALADLDGRVTYVNPAFLALWGFDGRKAVIGKDAAEDFWVDPALAHSAIAQLKQTRVWQGELLARTAVGGELPVRITAQLLLDEQGRPSAMLGNFIDIRSERAAHAALEAERQFTEMVIGSAGVLVAVLDEAGRFVRFNAECERLSGYRADEVLGRHFWETVLPPELAPTVRAEAFDAAMSRPPEQTTHYTNEWISRSGKRHLVEWTNRVTVDSRSLRRFMVTVGVDITARRESERALERSEAQLRLAQSVAQMGSWTLHVESLRLDWSDEVYRLFEVDRAGFEPTYASFMAAVHPDDRDMVAEAYQRALEARQPYRLEHRLQMPDGREKWVEERSRTVLGPRGLPVRLDGTVQDVTERRRRDVELQRFRLLVEHAPEEVWLTDDGFRVVYANAAACQSLGYTRRDLLGMHLADIDADGESSLRAITERVDAHRLTEAKPEVFRIRHRTADGRVVPKEMYATVRVIDGRRHGISFARDITVQLEAERALAASEAQLRDALDTYPGWVSCVDEKMRYVYVNQQFAEKLGRSPHELIGRTADEIIGPDGGEERWAILRRLIAGEHAQRAERRFVAADGSERFAWVEYRSSRMCGADRRRLFYAFATDITDLRQAQLRLATVTQDMGVGMWELTLPGEDLDFNDELLALIGFERHEIDGEPLAWLRSRVEPADRPGRIAVIGDIVDGRLPRAQIQMRVRHKDGHLVWIQEALRVISRDGQGRPRRLVGVAQDISPLKAREEELERLTGELEDRVARRTEALEKARREAEHANAAKSEFLSHMSHEFRTPLNAIMGFGQLLELSNLPGDCAEHVREVMHAGRHLLRLIDELLDLAAVEAGRVRLRQEAVSLVGMVADCTRLLAPEAQAAGLAMALGPAPENAVVRADARRLKQVLLNLLSNAIKYNRRGGRVDVTVLAGGHEQPPCWEVHVTDTGRGLTEGQVQRLFQPFERLGAERSGIQGTGIGLTLAQRLAETMGGSIAVASRPGQGSTFRLRLPAAAPEPMDGPAVAPPERLSWASEPPAAAGRHRLLYVEDNEANVRLLARFLERRGDLELRTVPTAREARALAPVWGPALMLIDIQLPDGDGNDLLDELRALGVKAPALAVSANAMPADLERGRRAGFARYLTKPLDLTRLLRVIDETVRQEADAGGSGA